MATRLGLYNVALRSIGERPLSSLSEEGEPRLLLDDVWTANHGIIHYALEQGQWKFALRAQGIDSDSSVTSELGYAYTFVIPDDLVSLNMISANEYFDPPLVDFEEEAGYWFADVDPLYVRFVSKDTNGYGGDLSMWPETFATWVGYHMGAEIAPRLTGQRDTEKIVARAKALLADARSKDALRGPVRFPPRGSWANARHGRRSALSERGKRNTLLD